MRDTAVLLAIVAMLSWGLWVVFANFAGEALSGEAIAGEAIGVVTYFVGGSIGVAYFLIRATSPSISSSTLLYAVVSGTFFGIGGLAYYAALRRGATATSTTIAVLYFVVTSILAFLFFGESLRVRDVVGIGLATGAVAILTT